MAPKCLHDKNRTKVYAPYEKKIMFEKINRILCNDFKI